MRVLIVEDDNSLAELVAALLRLEGFAVTVAQSGAEGLRLAADADLVVVDLGLPDISGLEVCRRLRADSDVGLVILTARGELVDRVLGLELGADDYILKPFNERELVARLRALQRRLSRGGRTADERATGTSICGPLEIDRRTRRVFLAGREVELTAREFDVLAYLAEEPGVVRTRDVLLTEIWDRNWFGSTKIVDLHVAALRRKLGDPAWIVAVRGVGFRFDVPRAEP